jgi:hypothetical protein
MRPSLVILTALFFACNPSDGQLCARWCGDLLECAQGVGADYNACFDGCQELVVEDPAYRTRIACNWDFDGTCRDEGWGAETCEG